MLFSWADFSPRGLAFMLSWACWLLPPGGCIFSPDCIAPLPWASWRFIGVAEEGAACSADGPSRPVPVPCALANSAPASNAAAATDIIRRLVIEYLLISIAHADNERRCAMFRDV